MEPFQWLRSYLVVAREPGFARKKDFRTAQQEYQGQGITASGEAARAALRQTRGGGRSQQISRFLEFINLFIG